MKDRSQKRSFVLSPFGQPDDAERRSGLYTTENKSKGEIIMKHRFSILFVLLAAALIASACGSAAGAPKGQAQSILSPEEASALIDTALQALNSGDYSTWSQDWADDMKAAIKDSDFQAYREQVLGQYGQYVAIESIEIQPGQNTDRVRWVAIADFEKGKIKYSFSFQPDGNQVKGIFPEAVK
jgi:hypothetical protein